jgi:PAS domain S-box-containing protein
VQIPSRDFPHPESPLVDELTLSQAVIDAVSDLIYCKDKDGRYLLVNRAHSARLNVPHQSQLGKTAFEIPNIGALAQLFHEGEPQIIASGEPIVNKENYFTWLDGAEGWYLTSKYPLRNAAGETVGIVGIGRDITERREAARKLNEERAMLRTVIDAVADAIFFKDAHGRFVLVNGAYERLFGLPTDTVIGKADREISMMHEFADAYAKDDHEVISTGKPVINREEPFPQLDGSRGWFLTSKFPLRAADGRIMGLVGIARDITERIKAEAAVRESQRLYHTLIEATETGYAVIDEHGRVVQANAEFVRLTGRRTFAEIEGRSVMEWTAPEAQEQNAREVARCVETGFTRNFETDYRWPNGQIAPIEINARVIETTKGRQIIALCRDITDRRAAELERQQIQRKVQETQKLESLGVLAGGIAHDFNNLLTSILGNAALAELDQPPDSPLVGHLRQIEIAATRAAELCKQMLAYSGKGRFVVRPLDLNALIVETTDLLRVSISKNAALDLDLAIALPAIEADATQLRQIVMNLVINASESLGEGSGSVRVSTGIVRVDTAYLAAHQLSSELTEGAYVGLEVTDTGFGMTPEVRDRIFDPFFTTKFAGRGLGLAAVLGIVRGHRGAMAIESEPGRGSTFRVLLPALTVPAEPEPPAPQLAGGWRGQGTALVVDDEPSVRNTAQQMLSALGFEVVTASDGAEGVIAFASAPDRFVLVLLDLTMPRLDGAAVLSKLREIRPEVRVVMMSGYNESELVSRLSTHGPSAFLQKPFRFNTLRDKLQAALA